MSLPKRHRVSLEVTYFLDISVPSSDEETAIIEIEKYLAKCDDYDIVNRSSDKQPKIAKVIREYPENK